MSDERPEALLKSALEKIIYFEARSEQLTNDLSAGREELERLRADLAQAAQREIGLRQELAEREVQLARSHRELQERARIIDALTAERTALVGKLIEASQIRGAGTPDAETDFDLASFIAQLRSEVVAQKSSASAPAPVAAMMTHVLASAPVGEQVPVAPQVFVPVPASAPAFAVAHARAGGAQPTSGASSVAVHAERLLSEGRLQVSEKQVLELSRQSTFEGRTEETLFGFSLRELSAPEPTARIRAADRLRALKNPAAASTIATALHAERHPEVRVALLNAFAQLARSEGAPVVSEHLGAKEPDVRIAALKALLHLDPSQAAPHLSAAMKDPDAAVRRRAALLAVGISGESALSLGLEAVSDTDVEVRSLGALALGASSGEKARAPLLQALKDPELKVRQAAAQSLSRLLGHDVSSVVSLDDAHRAREVRRLAREPMPARRPASVARTQVVGARAQANAPAGSVAGTAVVAHAVAAPAQLAHRAASVQISDSSGSRAVAGMSSLSAATSGGARSQIVAGLARAAHPGGAPANIGTAGTRAQVSMGPASAAAPGSGAMSAAVTNEARVAVVTAATSVVAPPAPSHNPVPARMVDEELCSAILSETRVSIRGRTLADLTSATARPDSVVIEACELLIARAQLVRRGQKYFVA